MKDIVGATVSKMNQLSGKNDIFFTELMQKVADGVNEIQIMTSSMKYSHHLIQTKRGIKRLDVTKRAGAAKRKQSSMVISTNSLDQSKRKDAEIEFYT